MFGYVCSLELGSSWCPSTGVWLLSCCCWWSKLSLSEANPWSNGVGTTPCDMFWCIWVKSLYQNTIRTIFQISSTNQPLFISKTVTCQNFEYILINLIFTTLFWFLMSGFVFVLTVSFFSSDYLSFLQWNLPTS